MQDSKELSPFGQFALQLDGDFRELEALSGQLERLEIESDSGFERAKLVLTRFGECGLRIGDGLSALSKALDEARARAEQTATRVSARAAQIQILGELRTQLTARFNSLAESVHDMNEKLTALKTKLQDPETASQLLDLQPKLAALAEEAGSLRKHARDAKMRSLEQNADSLAQALLTGKQKLSTLAERQGILH